MRKSGKLAEFFLLAALAYWSWDYVFPPRPTILSFRIGESFSDVVKKSTFPVVENSTAPDVLYGFGATWVTKPAVILKFNDPEHGFTLPATMFVVVTYLDGKVITVSTSPMLKKMRFDEAFVVLSKLQEQFKAGGWRPVQSNESVWYDLTPAGRQKLHQDVLDSTKGWAVTQELIVPGLYSMIFRIKCAENCFGEMGPDRYLIDIGLGEDLRRR